MKIGVGGPEADVISRQKVRRLASVQTKNQAHSIYFLFQSDPRNQSVFIAIYLVK
jgi:hypothetical protein